MENAQTMTGGNSVYGRSLPALLSHAWSRVAARSGRRAAAPLLSRPLSMLCAMAALQFTVIAPASAQVATLLPAGAPTLLDARDAYRKKDRARLAALRSQAALDSN